MSATKVKRLIYQNCYETLNEAVSQKHTK